MAEEKKPEETKKEGSFIEVLSTNKWDTLAYIVLFVGLLLSIFERLVGGSLVGLIVGFYFSSAVKDGLVQFKEYLTQEGIFKGFVLLAGALALFIASPGLVVGTFVGAFIQPYLWFTKQSKK